MCNIGFTTKLKICHPKSVTSQTLHGLAQRSCRRPNNGAADCQTIKFRPTPWALIPTASQEHGPFVVQWFIGQQAFRGSRRANIRSAVERLTSTELHNRCLVPSENLDMPRSNNSRSALNDESSCGPDIASSAQRRSLAADATDLNTSPLVTK